MPTSLKKNPATSAPDSHSGALIGPPGSPTEIACFCSKSGSILSVTDAFARKFGKSPSHWKGIAFVDFVHPDDKESWKSHCARSAENRTRIELCCKTSQGLRWFVWEVSLCADTSGKTVALRMLGHDTTRRHMAEEQSHILAEASEQSPIATAIADTNGFIHYVNRRYTELTGLSLEALIETRSQIFKEAHPTVEAYDAFLQQLRAGNPWRGEVASHSPKGETIWESVQITAIRNQAGSVTHFLMLREDITERKALEEQLRQAQKMESVGTLAGGIAHDFNNLLSVINGYAELMIAKPQSEADERQQKYVREIFKAGQRAVGLVRQILTFSRKGDVMFTPLDLNELIRELTSMLMETFPRTIAFEFDLDDALPSLLADQNQLQQIVMNLCVNARDAMPEGGTIKLSTSRICGLELARLGAKADAKFICLKISDTGCGMSPSVTKRIFEPFFTTKEKGAGTGLGLAVVEGIVSRHAGFIEVQSSVGKGSSFYIFLPEATTESVAHAHLVAGDDNSYATGRILIVEDEESLRKMVHGILENRGYSVATSEDGAQALAYLEGKASETDLVVLDINMPRLNGLSVFQVIKQKYPHLRVIVVSGYLTTEIRTRFAELGQEVFLNKPFRVDELLCKVHAALTAT